MHTTEMSSKNILARNNDNVISEADYYFGYVMNQWKLIRLNSRD